MKTNYLSWIVAAVAALVPLAMNPLGADAFSLPKLTVLALASLLGLTLFAWDAFENSAIHFRAPILWKAVGIWLLWCSLKTYFSTNPSGSFWGLYLFQFNGLLQFFLYAIVLWMAMRVERWREVEIALFSAAAIMCLYGIAQYFGMDPFPFKELGPGGRIWATMGNPNFFGMFITMVCPLLFACLLREERFIARALGLILFLLLFVCLFLTRARGAWIATAGGILLTAFGLRLSASGGRVRNLGLTVLGCAALAFLVSNGMSRLSLTATPGTASVSISERAASTVQFAGSGIQGRLSMWRTGLKLFKEKPLFGWGLDSAFSYNFRKFMEPRWESLTHPNAIPGYAHNEFLNVACDLGLVGLGIYLWILVLFFRQAFSAGEFGALGAVSALLIQNLFSFSTITGGFLFWLLLGRVYSREPLRRLSLSVLKKVRLAESAKEPAGGVATLLILALGYFALNPLRADMHFQRGKAHVLRGEWLLAVREMEETGALWPQAFWYSELRGKALAQLALLVVPKDRLTTLQLSEKQYHHFIRGYPQIAFGYNGLGTAYAFGAQFFPAEKKYLENAILTFQEAIRRDPYFTEAYSNLAMAREMRGERGKALEILREGIRRKPEIAHLHFNLGMLLSFQGKMGLAIEEWKKTIELEPNHSQAQARLSQALLR